jgi:hypothetical protein
MHCAMAQRKRSRKTSFLFATEKNSTAGESGFVVGASSVCLMGKETGLAEIFRNDFAQELIHLSLHVIHSASVFAREFPITPLPQSQSAKSR